MREFLATDRCDRCGARAKHAATKDDLAELLFCDHHYREAKFRLMENYWTVESNLSPDEPLSTVAYTE